MHYLLGFTGACTSAVFWEFAEFASDQLLGTAIQESLTETILDLLFGVIGATIMQLTVFLARRLARSGTKQ